MRERGVGGRELRGFHSGILMYRPFPSLLFLFPPSCHPPFLASFLFLKPVLFPILPTFTLTHTHTHSHTHTNTHTHSHTYRHSHTLTQTQTLTQKMLALLTFYIHYSLLFRFATLQLFTQSALIDECPDSLLLLPASARLPPTPLRPQPGLTHLYLFINWLWLR